MGNDIGKSVANNLRDAAKCLLGRQYFYPNYLAKANQLALTVASNERSFSKLRLVKTKELSGIDNVGRSSRRLNNFSQRKRHFGLP